MGSQTQILYNITAAMKKDCAYTKNNAPKTIHLKNKNQLRFTQKYTYVKNIHSWFFKKLHFDFYFMNVTRLLD